ncbi:MAG TPA: hypothetical protein VJB67_02105 [Patescibacteria group bacterium]|nr:hypothetical protein [Patescibacteria group bacterium]
MKKKDKLKHKAWIITVDMGYGHQRASYPLRHLAKDGIIAANNYPGITEKDKSAWANSRKSYEFISRFKKVPFLGEKTFEIYDRLQSIPKFYPRRDLSKPNLQLKGIYNMIKKFDWGKHLIDKLDKDPLPMIHTFFVTAFMAEIHGYSGEIYCLATDTDISRTWAPLNPTRSKINYFAPNSRVAERLKLYGVRPNKIYVTGFPLPDENVGENLKVVKQDLGRRLINLDSKKIYLSQYQKTIVRHIGENNLKKNPTRPLTITFAVGGAGAQRELGREIIISLTREILAGKVNINLVAGVHPQVNNFFHQAIKEAGLNRKLNQGVKVIFTKSKPEYFKRFNRILKTTDILWTKPSELSFYCALGIPIVMAPPIGSQEIFNRQWLQSIGAGINQEDPRYTNEWLLDWIDSGWLAEAAMQGFLEAPKYGTYNIEKIIFHQSGQAKRVKTVLQY